MRFHAIPSFQKRAARSDHDDSSVASGRRGGSIPVSTSVVAGDVGKNDRRAPNSASSQKGHGHGRRSPNSTASRRKHAQNDVGDGLIEKDAVSVMVEEMLGVLMASQKELANKGGKDANYSDASTATSNDNDCDDDCVSKSKQRDERDDDGKMTAWMRQLQQIEAEVDNDDDDDRTYVYEEGYNDDVDNYHEENYCDGVVDGGDNTLEEKKSNDIGASILSTMEALVKQNQAIVGALAYFGKSCKKKKSLLKDKITK